MTTRQRNALVLALSMLALAALIVSAVFFFPGCSATTTVGKDGTVTATQKVAANAYAAAMVEASIVAGYHGGLVKCSALKQVYAQAIAPSRKLIDAQWDSVNAVGASADWSDYLDKAITGIEIVGNGQAAIEFRKRALAPNLSPAEIEALADEAEAAEDTARTGLDAIYLSCGGKP